MTTPPSSPSTGIMDSHGLRSNRKNVIGPAARVSRHIQRRDSTFHEISRPCSRGTTEVTTSTTNEAPRLWAHSTHGGLPQVNATSAETRLTLSVVTVRNGVVTRETPSSDRKPRPSGILCGGSKPPSSKCESPTHPAATPLRRQRLRRKRVTFHEMSAPPCDEDEAFSTYEVPMRTAKSIDDIELRPNVKTGSGKLPPIACPRTSINNDALTAEFNGDLKFRPFPTILDDYKPVREIGKCSYGVVYAVEERYTSTTSMTPRVFACKVLKADNSNCDDVKQVLQDALKKVELVMSSGGHPNIQDLVDFAVTENRMFMISSMCYGGDLRMALDKHGVFCEDQARSAMAGIFRGLSHLHSQGIVHRDIRLDNILVAEKGNLGSVKIIDMGFAKKLYPQNEALHTVCGSPIYIAPEMVAPSEEVGTIKNKKPGCGMEVDMWSCGVVMFTLLAGYPPFSPEDSKSIQELYADIRRGRLTIDQQAWHDISESAKGLIMGLLNVDPNKRLSAQQALRHPWFLDSSDNFLDSFAVAPPRIRCKLAGTARINLLRHSSESGLRS